MESLISVSISSVDFIKRELVFFYQRIHYERGHKEKKTLNKFLKRIMINILRKSTFGTIFFDVYQMKTSFHSVCLFQEKMGFIPLTLVNWYETSCIKHLNLYVSDSLKELLWNRVQFSCCIREVDGLINFCLCVRIEMN